MKSVSGFISCAAKKLRQAEQSGCKKNGLPGKYLQPSVFCGIAFLWFGSLSAQTLPPAQILPVQQASLTPRWLPGINRFVSVDPTKVHSFLVPANTYRLQFSISGAAGGYGGLDAGPFGKPEKIGSYGSEGGRGATWSGTLKVVPGQTIDVVVGAGGQNAAEATAANPLPPGGRGGVSAEGKWRAGNGGNPGKVGFSGKGGGGGGATYIALDGNVVVIAAGGGGGQGGAFRSETGERGWGGDEVVMQVEMPNCNDIQSVADGRGDGEDFEGNGDDGSGGGGGGMGWRVGRGGYGKPDGDKWTLHPLEGRPAKAGQSCHAAKSIYFDGEISFGEANNNAQNGTRNGFVRIDPLFPTVLVGVNSRSSTDRFVISTEGLWTTSEVVTQFPGVVAYANSGLWLMDTNLPFDGKIALPFGWQLDSIQCHDENKAVTQNPDQISARVTGKDSWRISANHMRSAAKLKCELGVSLQKMTLNARLIAEQQPGQFIQPFPDAAIEMDDCAGQTLGNTSTNQNGFFSFTGEVQHAGSDRCIQQSLPAGWKVNKVSCIDRATDQSGNKTYIIHPPAVAANRWRLEAAFAKPGSNWECRIDARYLEFQISGQVLRDNGSGSGGVAHDGIANGEETGRAGVPLSLDNCAGKIYEAGQLSTDDGRFSFYTDKLDAGPVCIRQTLPPELYPVSFHGGSAHASYRRDERGHDELRFDLLPKTSYSGLVFGHIDASLLVGSGQQVIAAGSSATFAHIYTAASSASIRFSSPESDRGTPEEKAGWFTTLYHDRNCNARQDADDSAVDPAESVLVKAGDRVCVLQRIQSPSSALPARRFVSQLLVSETVTPQISSGLKQIVRQLRADNLTEISNAGDSLKLSKQVRQVAGCPSTAADTSLFSAGNQALPGSYVEYLLGYRNVSGLPLHDLVISDAVPAFTRFMHASCDALPVPGLKACEISAPAVGETEKPIRWTLTEAPASQPGDPQGLQPGAGGTLRYCVQIEY